MRFEIYSHVAENKDPVLKLCELISMSDCICHDVPCTVYRVYTHHQEEPPLFPSRINY